MVVATAAALTIFATRADAAPLVVDVTSTADTHTPGTLRDAVDQANAGVFDDVTINLPAGTYTLDLCGPPGDDTNATGDLDITQSSPVTIVGTGGVPTIAMTCAGERVIDRLGTGLFTLSRVHITGGHAIGEGGGVRANSAVTVTDSIFDANRANGINGTAQVCNGAPGTGGGPAAGGAIATNFDVTVTGSTFTDNQARGGTGGTSYVITCLPDGSFEGGPSFGGAIRTNGHVTVAGSTFTANRSNGGTGGANFDFPGFTAGGGDAEGGAVWAAGGTDLTTTILDDNRAVGGHTAGRARGGAIVSGGATTVTDSQITNNVAGGSDGNAWACSAFVGGAATGGGIISSGSLDLVRSDLSTNRATGGPGGSGASFSCPGIDEAGGPAYGAGASAQGDVRIEASTVTGNVATAGSSGASCDTFTCHYGGGANASGGGIQAGGASVIVDSTVADNAAVSKSGSTVGFSYGGGVFSSSGSNVIDTSFLRNHAQGSIGSSEVPAGQSAGGGLWDNGAITIDGSTFAGNLADNGPGGDASAGGQSGGAASVSPIAATNSTFDANGANNISAGAALGAPTLTLEYVTVAGNIGSSALRGGTLVTSRSVIADQVGGVLCEFGATTTGGFNWADDTTCALTDPTDDQTGTNPMLAPLADNGGPTFTRMPDAASPLVDAIAAASCDLAVDQRDATRPGATNCDIGAVERNGVLPTTTTTSTSTTSTSSTTTSTSTTSTTTAPTTTTSTSTTTTTAPTTTTTAPTTTTTTTTPATTTTTTAPTTTTTTPATTTTAPTTTTTAPTTTTTTTTAPTTTTTTEPPSSTTTSSTSSTSTTSTTTPPDGAALAATLSAGTATVGGSLAISGSGCPSGAPVMVALDGIGTLTQPVAGTTGTFATTFAIPTTATAGANTIRVTCGTGTVVLGVTLTAAARAVNAATPVPVQGSLPLTGTDPMLPLIVGLLTLAGGLSLTIAARRGTRR